MKFLITGSSGFIGSALTQELRSLRLPFDVLKRQEYGAGPGGVKWPEGVRDLDLSSYSAVIHLATAPVLGHSTSTSVRRENLDPVRHFIERIQKSNPECRFVFVTSQSARDDARSLYGQSKWECECELRGSAIPWTIVRPGLVVDRQGTGVFNRIAAIIRRFPVIPLVGRGRQIIQVVSRSLVVDSLIKIAREPGQHDKREYVLASAPVHFREFCHEIAACLNKRIITVPIPAFVPMVALFVLEKISHGASVSRSSLIGLLNNRSIEASTSEARLGLSIPSVQEALRSMFGRDSAWSLKEEGRWLHQKLFGFDPSEKLLSSYVRAHDFYGRSGEEGPSIQVKKIAERNLDVEAIEYALRRRKNILSKKMTILCYLAEMEGPYYDFFVNTVRRPVGGFLMLASACLTAPLKFFKGKYLIWRHGCV